MTHFEVTKFIINRSGSAAYIVKHGIHEIEFPSPETAAYRNVGLHEISPQKRFKTNERCLEYSVVHHMVYDLLDASTPFDLSFHSTVQQDSWANRYNNKAMVLTEISFWFENDSDAVAFKLKWSEELADDAWM
jgi:hypothetical protein